MLSTYQLIEQQVDAMEKGRIFFPDSFASLGSVTAFSAIIRDDEKTYEESIEKVNLDITCNQLFTNCSEQVKALIISIKDGEFSVKEMQLFTNCSPESKPSIAGTVL